MHPAEFEPATPSSERPQTHALGRAAIGFGKSLDLLSRNICTVKGSNGKT